MRWAGNIDFMGEKRNVYKVLVKTKKESDY
jgi:hypothetical protein